MRSVHRRDARGNAKRSSATGKLVLDPMQIGCMEPLLGIHVDPDPPKMSSCEASCHLVLTDRLACLVDVTPPKRRHSCKKAAAPEKSKAAKPVAQLSMTVRSGLVVVMSLVRVLLF